MTLRHVLSTALLSLGLMSTATAKDLHTITLHINDLQSAKGDVHIIIYNDPSTFLHKEQALRRIVLPAQKGQLTTSITDLPPGTYAISLFHDEDSSGDLTRNFFRMPAEGTGLSNDARPHMGPPRYEDASFELNNDATVQIHTVY